jgi:hypothetical protein
LAWFGGPALAYATRPLARQPLQEKHALAFSESREQVESVSEGEAAELASGKLRLE